MSKLAGGAIWHLQTPTAEALLKIALTDPLDGAENIATVQKRIDELLPIPEDRCHVSRDQQRYLQRVLEEVNAKS